MENLFLNDCQYFFLHQKYIFGCMDLNASNFNSQANSDDNSCIGCKVQYANNFCESCNRVWLTCTGILYMCLGQDDNVDLKNILRNKGSSFLENSLFKAISKKPKGHDFNISKSGINISSNRHMSLTGG